MNHATVSVAKGLAGVVVDQTAISDVQAQGRLIYRGHDIETLAERPFEEVASLVVLDRDEPDLADFLAAHANLAAWETAMVLNAPAETHPMHLVQGMLPLLDTRLKREPLAETSTDVLQGLVAAAKVPAVVATHLRRCAVELDEDLTYAERFLCVVRDEAPAQLDADLVSAFNLAQVLQVEHSFNAGTFAARVVASTLASVQSAMSAGVGALSGALHGGADQAAIEIADGLADAEAVRAYVDEVLAESGRIPGMGHREYRVRDPRAKVLEHWAEKLAGRDAELAATFATLRTLDEVFRARMLEVDKAVHPNVEFYKGLVYRAIGLPNAFFTTGFAMARVFGYVAHFAESRQDNRIFRPQASYVGKH